MSNAPHSSHSPQSGWSFPAFASNSNAPTGIARPTEESELYLPTDFQPETTEPTEPTEPSTARPASVPSSSAQPQFVGDDTDCRTARREEPTTRSVSSLRTTSVWGLPFAIATMEDAIDLADQVIQARKPEFFITANMNYLMLTDEHLELQEVNRKCLCFLADGNPIVWRSKLEPNPLPCRVAGSDMIIELARLSEENGYRIFLLGGAPGVAETAAENLQCVFPNLQISGTYSPPFRQLSSEEHQQVLARIREAKTDILLVAFGQPKGELWIHDNFEQLQVPLSIQLGASFDFLAGTAKRAPKFWQMIGCEWLYRALSDPKRLLPRYGKNLLFLTGLMVHDLSEALQNLLASLRKGRSV